MRVPQPIKHAVAVAARGVRWVSEFVPFPGPNARMTAVVAATTSTALGARDLKNYGWLGALKWAVIGGAGMWASEELVDWDRTRNANAWEWTMSHAAKGLHQVARIVPLANDYTRATTLIGALIGAIKGITANPDEHRAVSILKEALLLGVPRYVDASIASGILTAADWD